MIPLPWFSFSATKKRQQDGIRHLIVSNKLNIKLLTKSQIKGNNTKEFPLLLQLLITCILYFLIQLKKAF